MNDKMKRAVVYTKQDIQDKAELIRERFKYGRLSAKEITQYESLSGWYWSKLYMPFAKARTLARAQHFTNYLNFKTWKRPKGMPSHPDEAYKNTGWVGYGDFLGTGNSNDIEKPLMTFTKARRLTRAQHFSGKEEFSKWTKPVGMRAHPDRVYKTLGWIGWYDFLGKEENNE